MITKKAMKEFVKHMLATNDEWVVRAVQVVLRNQTAVEKASGETIDRNYVGFTGFDAEILTSIGDQAAAGRRLSGKQVALLHRMMPKYWAQIVESARMAGRYPILEQKAVEWKGTVVS